MLYRNDYHLRQLWFFCVEIHSIFNFRHLHTKFISICRTISTLRMAHDRYNAIPYSSVCFLGLQWCSDSIRLKSKAPISLSIQDTKENSNWLSIPYKVLFGSTFQPIIHSASS